MWNEAGVRDAPGSQLLWIGAACRERPLLETWKPTAVPVTEIRGLLGRGARDRNVIVAFRALVGLSPDTQALVLATLGSPIRNRTGARIDAPTILAHGGRKLCNSQAWDVDHRTPGAAGAESRGGCSVNCLRAARMATSSCLIGPRSSDGGESAGRAGETGAVVTGPERLLEPSNVRSP